MQNTTTMNTSMNPAQRRVNDAHRKLVALSQFTQAHRAWEENECNATWEARNVALAVYEKACKT